MVIQIMVRTNEGKNPICDRSPSYQMPWTYKKDRDCSLRAQPYLSYHLVWYQSMDYLGSNFLFWREIGDIANFEQ